MKCEHLKKKLNSLISDTNYRVMPLIPKYLGSYKVKINKKVNHSKIDPINNKAINNAAETINGRSNGISDILQHGRTT